MHKILKFAGRIFFILLSFSCYGQIGIPGNTIPSNEKYKFNIDTNIPLGVLPMQFNSSFAGEADEPRINTSFLYQQPIVGAPQLKFFASFDQFIPSIGSGIGFTAGYGRPTGGYSEGGSLFLNFGIAPKFSVGGKFTISPSLNINYDRSYLYLQVQCIDASGNQIECIWNTETTSSNAGILLNSHKFYIGYSVNLFSNLKYSRSEFDYNVKFRSGFQSTLQIGYTFESADSKFSVTPQIVIGIGDRYVDNFNTLLWSPYNRYSRYLPLSPIGPDKFVISFRYDRFLWGLSDVGPQIGWQNDRFRFIISNNLNFYNLNINPFSFISGTRRNYTEGNISNFAFRYIFTKNDKSTRNW